MWIITGLINSVLIESRMSTREEIIQRRGTPLVDILNHVEQNLVLLDNPFLHHPRFLGDKLDELLSRNDEVYH